MEKIKTNWVAYATLAVVVFLAFAFSKGEPRDFRGGSIAQGQELNSTTTNAVMASNNPQVLKASPGSLGSVVVTKSGLGTGSWILYNATTSDVNKRTGQKATTSIIQAVLPANATVGTYVYDSTFSDGLLADFVASQGTSTISWR